MLFDTLPQTSEVFDVAAAAARLRQSRSAATHVGGPACESTHVMAYSAEVRCGTSNLIRGIVCAVHVRRIFGIHSDGTRVTLQHHEIGLSDLIGSPAVHGLRIPGWFHQHAPDSQVVPK